MSDQTENPQDDDPEREAEAPLDAHVDPVPTALDEPLQIDEPDLAAQIIDLTDQLLRAKAETENTRRIAAREKQDASKYALTNFARDILRVADNLGFAMMSVSDEARKSDQNLDNLFVGIDMTMKELLSVFGAFNIKPVVTDGTPFDHNIHEAVQQVENAELPANTVVKTLRGGYTLQDRLLRPAQVIVSTGGAKADPIQISAETTYEAPAKTPGQNVDQET